MLCTKFARTTQQWLIRMCSPYCVCLCVADVKARGAVKMQRLLSKTDDLKSVAQCWLFVCVCVCVCVCVLQLLLNNTGDPCIAQTWLFMCVPVHPHIAGVRPRGAGQDAAATEQDRRLPHPYSSCPAPRHHHQAAC